MRIAEFHNFCEVLYACALSLLFLLHISVKIVLFFIIQSFINLLKESQKNRALFSSKEVDIVCRTQKTDLKSKLPSAHPLYVHLANIRPRDARNSL